MPWPNLHAETKFGIPELDAETTKIVTVPAALADATSQSLNLQKKSPKDQGPEA